MEGGSNSSWTVSRSTVLTKSETPIPTPGPSQVLVRVNAVSLNHRDHTVLHHTYPLPTKANLVPCSDGAGTVVGAGPGSSWATRSGEVVILHPNTWLEGDLRNFDVESVLGGGDAHGTLTEYIVLDDVQIQEAPTNLTVEEASTLPTAALTAWNALFMGPIPCGPGISILTQGTGGVSSFAIQLAAAAGATVIATSSSEEKLEVAKLLGATHLINYRKIPNWSEEVLRITSGHGVDHVVNVAGSSTMEESLHSVRQGGVVSVLGMLSESKKTDLVPMLMMGGKTLRGVLGAGNKEMHEQLVKFIEHHDIHPTIARVFEFDQAVDAFAYMEKHSEVGKIIIRADRLITRGNV
ncbi:Polyketide synthase enoylreductase [Penicillium expansum]|nr:Polyketide synthase enoylreductase [Penicillium expansum]